MEFFKYSTRSVSMKHLTRLPGNARNSIESPKVSCTVPGNCLIVTVTVTCNL